MCNQFWESAMGFSIHNNMKRYVRRRDARPNSDSKYVRLRVDNLTDRLAYRHSDKTARQLIGKY